MREFPGLIEEFKLVDLPFVGGSSHGVGVRMTTPNLGFASFFLVTRKIFFLVYPSN